MGANHHEICDGIASKSQGSDSTWFIIDRFTKSAHFLPVQCIFSVEGLAHVYIQEIVYLYGRLVSIISHQGSQFTSSLIESISDRVRHQG